MKPAVPKPQRCAIYTRKSTEHNLDLEFNSLDAQREACEAYIKSQAHEGWRLIPDRYDDGGLSGASPNPWARRGRPASSQQLWMARHPRISRSPVLPRPCPIPGLSKSRGLGSPRSSGDPRTP
jgi:Resolvase, N terminal domain